MRERALADGGAVAGVDHMLCTRHQQEMTLDDCRGDVGQLAAVVLGVVAEQLERTVRVDGVTRHKDSLRLLDQSATAESTLQVLVLREALERYVDRALQLVGRSVDDV